MGISDFLALLSPEFIYSGGKNLAAFVASTITPVLLVIAIWLRLSSVQLNSAVSGQGRFAEFFKDLAVWVTILGLYFALAGMLSDFFNSLYSHFQQHGSYGAIQSRFAEMIEEIDEATAQGSLLQQSLSLLTAPVTFIAWLFYFLSFLVTTVLMTFIGLAHAVTWSFALVWGLVAIPMSITSSFKLLKGWGIFTGIALVWPLIHYGTFALFAPIFEHAANEFTSVNAALASIDKAGLYLIMTIVNTLAFAFAIAAPFITMSLVSNSGSIAGVVAPFASAAVASGAAAFAQIRAGTSAGSRVAGRGALVAGKDIIAGRNPLNRVEQGLQSIKNSIMGPEASASGPIPSQRTGGFTPSQDSSSGNRSTGGNSSSSNESGSTQSANTDSSASNSTNSTSSENKTQTAKQSSGTSKSTSTTSKVAKAAVASTGFGVPTPDQSSVSESISDHKGDDQKPKPSNTRSKQAQQRRGAIINQNKLVSKK